MGDLVIIAVIGGVITSVLSTGSQTYTARAKDIGFMRRATMNNNNTLAPDHSVFDYEYREWQSYWVKE